MKCTEFVELYSDYHDGIASAGTVARMDQHVEECPRCRKYAHVMNEGVSVLRSVDGLDVPGDFEARLRHRLYHVDEEDTLLSHAHSGATALAVLSIALVLTAVAWSPMLRPAVPQVEVSPLVVSAPPVRQQLRAMTAYPFADGGQAVVQTAGPNDLFGDAHRLLFQYSQLSQRYSRPVVRQVGFGSTR